MTGPRRFLIRMVIFLAAVLVVAAFLAPQVIRAFDANPWLNGMIFGVLLFGIVFIFRQVLMIGPEVSWLEAYRRGQATSANPPKLLAPPVISMLKLGARMPVPLASNSAP